MFLQIFLIIFATFSPSFGQPPERSIQVPELTSLVGVKAKTDRIMFDLFPDHTLVMPNNEIAISMLQHTTPHVTVNKTLLTKIANELQFAVRVRDNFRHCRPLLDYALSKNCKVMDEDPLHFEWSVICRDSLINEQSGLGPVHFAIRHQSLDRFQIVGWEQELYTTISIFYMEFFNQQQVVPDWACQFQIVFNSQLSKPPNTQRRQGNRDYVLLMQRDPIKNEYREEWFTNLSPQPAQRDGLPTTTTTIKTTSMTSTKTTPKTTTTMTTIEPLSSTTTTHAPTTTTMSTTIPTTRQTSTTPTETTSAETEAFTMSTTISEAPSTTTSEAPSTTTSEAPSTTTLEAPSTTISEAPSTTTSEAPSTTISEAPSTTTSEAPSTTTLDTTENLTTADTTEESRSSSSSSEASPTTTELTTITPLSTIFTTAMTTKWKLVPNQIEFMSQTSFPDDIEVILD